LPNAANKNYFIRKQHKQSPKKMQAGRTAKSKRQKAKNQFVGKRKARLIAALSG